MSNFKQMKSVLGKSSFWNKEKMRAFMFHFMPVIYREQISATYINKDKRIAHISPS